MLEGIIVGVVTASIMIIINAIIHRTGVQTKTDRMADKIDELEQGQVIIFKALIPLILALKGKKANGEVEEALHAINEYLIRK